MNRVTMNGPVVLHRAHMDRLAWCNLLCAIGAINHPEVAKPDIIETLELAMTFDSLEITDVGTYRLI